MKAFLFGIFALALSFSASAHMAPLQQVQNQGSPDPQMQPFVLSIERGGERLFLYCYPFQPGIWACGWSDTAPNQTNASR